jgi:hypothetical protein
VVVKHIYLLWYRNADRDDIPPDYQVVVVLLREDDLEHMHFLWYRNADRDDIPPDYQVVVVLLREEDDLEHIYLL